ncbi:MAG: hypothetical protein EOO89_02425 [Pedobacter sp.]|nr:MAG: hypothetical protein EOO89_02425 [Pedobacter sp.]
MSRYYKTHLREDYIYDVDFQTNILDVAYTFGFDFPNRVTLIALDKFMRAIKSNGIYYLCDTMVNFALNNSSLKQFSLIDWKRKSKFYITHGGLNYTAGGWEGNSINGYIDTGFNPVIGTNNYSINNAGRTVILHKIAETSNFIDGNIGGQHMRAALSTQQRICNSININTNADLIGIGLKSINRDSNETIRLYNKKDEYIRSSLSSTITNGNYWLLRSTSSYGDCGISNYIMGASLNRNQLIELRTAYNKYLSSIGLTPIA